MDSNRGKKTGAELIGKALAKVFGTQNERDLKRIAPRVGQINALEPEMQRLTDEQLRAKTDEFRARIKERLQEAEPEISPVTELLHSAPPTASVNQPRSYIK